MPRTTRTQTKRKVVEHLEPEEIESTLEDIYQDTDGTIPDMHTFERRKSKTGFVVTFFILLFLAAAGGAAWLGFFIFNPAKKFSEEAVVVSIVKPTSFVVGTESDFEIDVTNNNNIAIANADLEISVPEQFVVTHANPAAITPKNVSWVLGSIAGKETKKIVITGVSASPKDVAGTIHTLLTYRPANFNAEFQRTNDTDVVTTQDALTASLNRKTSDKEQFSITYKNISGAPFSGAQLAVTLGSNFTVAKTSTSTAKTVAGVTTLTLPTLAAAEEGTFVITGSYKGTPQTPQIRIQKVFGDRTLTLAEIRPADEPAVPPTAPTNADSSEPVIIERTNGTSAIKPGDEVILHARFKNTTSAPVSLKTLVIQAETPTKAGKGIFDFTNLQTTSDPTVIGKAMPNDRRLATITWTKEQLGSPDVAPGQSVDLTLHITRKADSAMIPSTANTINLVTNVEFESGEKASSEPVSLQLAE